MSRLGIRASAVAALVAATPTPAWQAASAGYTVTWSARDIVATRSRSATPLFSARAFAAADYARARKDADGGTLTYERRFRVMALVGSYLSLRDETYIDLRPSAHPGGETRLVTIDLAHPGSLASPRFVDLAALVGPARLTKALAADPFVRRAGGSSAQTLDAMRDALGEGQTARNACYEVPADWTRRFAIVHMSADRVEVRLGLPGSGPCRYNLTQIGLSLAPPGVLRRSFVQRPPDALAPLLVRFGPANGATP